ncbi:MAG: cyclic nucleotide-binding domain-containing protein [Streptosporangiaceae bacterium]
MDSQRQFLPSSSQASESVSFWDALDPVQKHKFRSLAAERTFAGGARLMREGEQGDHVMVILRGRVEIWASEGDDAERVIAHRGPGQLVGERAILDVNVRSATVVASEMVHALVMTTEDFARFVSTNQQVLNIVQSQLRERHPRGPIRYEGAHALRDRDSMAIHTGNGHFLNLTVGHPQALNGENCMIIFTDVAGFSSPDRTDEHRRIIRREVLRMTAVSLAAIWDQCSREDRGDGLLIVVPPNIPTAQVLEYLYDSLPRALRRHNSIYGPGAHVQLRVALDVGPVTSDDLGVSGQVINNASRLLDAPALKNAIAADRANLGFIISDFIYQTAIRNGGGLSDPSAYTEVEVKVKEADLRGWVQVVDPILPARPPRDALVPGGTMNGPLS